MKTNLLNQVRNLQVRNPASLARLVEEAVRLSGFRASANSAQGAAPALNLVFVSEKRIRRINTVHLGRRGRTDVIAFDLRAPALATPPAEAPMPPFEEEQVAAEIYICPQVAVRAARSYQTTPEEEIILYLVHGLLHLAGWRDDTPGNQEKMREAEQRIMRRLQEQFSPATIIRVTGKSCPPSPPCRRGDSGGTMGP